MVAFGDTDPCLHCQETLIFQVPEERAWQKAYWVHKGSGEVFCAERDHQTEGARRAKPVHYCDAKLADYSGETCNRPVKEFGRCNIHNKDARAEFEAQKRINELLEQDHYVQDTVGPLIEYWNTAYDLDARLEEQHDGNSYRYRNGKARYTGYVLVNPARLADIMTKIEEEF